MTSTAGDLFIKMFTMFMPSAKVKGLKVTVPLKDVVSADFGVGYKVVKVGFANGLVLTNEEVKAGAVYKVVMETADKLEVSLLMSDRLFFTVNGDALMISLV